jgi:hypothetical protein
MPPVWHRVFLPFWSVWLLRNASRPKMAKTTRQNWRHFRSHPCPATPSVKTFYRKFEAFFKKTASTKPKLRHNCVALLLYWLDETLY